MSQPSRRQQILEALALMLETRPGSRITTAALADRTAQHILARRSELGLS